MPYPEIPWLDQRILDLTYSKSLPLFNQGIIISSILAITNGGTYKHGLGIRQSEGVLERMV